MIQFISRVRHRVFALKRMSVGVEKEDISMAMLCELSKQFYHSIVTIFTMDSGRSFTSRFVKSCLLRKKQFTNHKVNENKGGNLAPFEYQNRPKSVVRRYCEKQQHVQKNCFKKQRGRVDKSQRAPFHTPIQHANNVNDREQGKLDILRLIATGTQKNNNSIWIVFSGATALMTYDARIFESYTSEEIRNMYIESDHNL